MKSKGPDFGGCLIAVFVLMVLIGCLFSAMEKLFGSAGEAVGYAVMVLVAFAVIRHLLRSVKK